MNLNKGIIYYTDNRLDEKIFKAVQEQLLKARLPIVSVSLKPIDFGKNIHLPLQRGYETYFRQIITALENSESDIIFFCEHDVLYHPSYFDFTPEKKDTYYYNLNVWRWKYPENHCVTWDAHQVAQLCSYKEVALEWYRKKLASYQEDAFDRKFEPEDKFEEWRSVEPNIDIRHGNTLTKSKWTLKDFRNKLTAVNFKEGKCPDWAKLLPVEKKLM